MKIVNCIFCFLAVGLLTACVSGASGAYSGSGGMAAYQIKPEVYAYHYDHGFTGPDAMGWDPNLQYAWSRTGAAKLCKVKADEDKIIKNLMAKFGEMDLIHKMNGIEFHYLQASQAGSSFCTPERVEELKTVIPQMEAGNFPKKF